MYQRNFKLYLTGLLILFIQTLSFSQVIHCTQLFKKYYHAGTDDEAADILNLPGNQVLLVGKTNAADAGNSDGLIMKLSNDGSVIWNIITGFKGDDRFLSIKANGNLGFYILGVTYSFKSNGQPWIVKIDTSGKMIWSKVLIRNNDTATQIPQSLTVLSDGNVILLVNTSNDGQLIKMDPSGSIQWQEDFKNGAYSAVNAVTEYNDQLIVSALATVVKKEAVMTILDKNTGAVKRSWTFPRSSTYNYELTNAVFNGKEYSMAIRSLLNAAGESLASDLTVLRMDTAGYINFSRNIDLSTASGYTIVKINRFNFYADGSVMFLYGDTTPKVNSRVFRYGPTGIIDWGRQFNDQFIFSSLRCVNGMDQSDGGYVFAGTENEYSSGYQNRISLYKTNAVGGGSGTCFPSSATCFDDSVKINPISFSWEEVTMNNFFRDSLVNPVVNNSIAFTEETVCTQQYCDTIYNLGKGCNKQFFLDFPSLQSFNITATTYTPDAGYAIAGAVQFSLPIIIKMDGTGNILWTKTFDAYYQGGYFSKILTTKDGNILAVGTISSVINHGVSDSCLIAKLDNNGNILWANMYAQDFGDRPFDILEADNGDFLFTAYDQMSYDASYDRLIIRIDASGKVLWKKNIININSPTYNTLVLSGNDLYAGGLSFHYPMGVNPCLAKYNALTGDLIWSKFFYAQNNNPLQMLHIGKVNDTIVCFSNEINPVGSFPDYNHLAVTRFLTDGTMLGSNHIKDINISNQASNEVLGLLLIPDYMAATSDNNFVMAQQMADTKKLSLTKLDIHGNIIWSKLYPGLYNYSAFSVKAQPKSILVSGNYFTGDASAINAYQAYLMKTDENGSIAENGTGKCEVSDQTFTTDTLTVNEIDSLLDNANIPADTTLYYKPYRYYVEDLNIHPSPSCYTPDICSYFNIYGQDSMCLNNQFYKYSFARSPGCNSQALWQPDSSQFLYNIINADTIQAKALKTGTYSIKAIANSGCGSQIISKNVFVGRLAGSLNIGKDTTICPGSSITLNAGTGFKNYQWQDLSLDSVITVSTAGKYFVSVTDACGNTASDTVTVQVNSRINIDIGNNFSLCYKDSLLLNAPAGFASYQWSPNYNITSLVNPATAIYPYKDTSYSLIVKNAMGCVGYDTISVVVSQPAEISLGNDTAICINDTLLLYTPEGFKNYAWNTGATTSSIAVSAAGTYSVRITDANNCISRDTILLSVKERPVFSLGRDTTLCEKQTLLLQTSTQGTYLWQDGTQLNTQLVATAGLYWLQISSNGCSFRDSVRVDYHPLPIVHLPADTTLCDTSTLVMDVSQTGTDAAYLWQDGTTNFHIQINQPGIYSVKVTEGKCSAADTCVVTYAYVPVINLGNDSIKCEEDKISLNVTFPGSTYLWQDMSTSPVYDILHQGTYYCTISNYCGSASDTVIIKDQKCVCQLIVPNAFSPNGDGINDDFRPNTICIPSYYHLVIFDRNGQLIFESSDINNYWKGTYHGKPVPIGTYYYMIKVKSNSDPVIKEKFGGVTILR